MSERSVSVRLLAITNQYDNAMRNSGRVTTDLGTQAQLSGTRVDALGDSVGRANKQAKDAKPSFSALGISIAALGPAIVPLAGVALTGTAALAGMGAAGVLAFKGIKEQMAAGTPLGAAYAAQVQKLQGNLAALEQTAASGVFDDFQQAVTALQGDLPNVNGEIKTFTTQLGTASGAGFQGLLNGAYLLEPALQQVGGFLDDLALKFEHFTQDGGLSKFAEYAESVLPKVEALLNDLGTTVGHLVQGFAPLGGMVVTELSLASQAINAIPVPVLKDLIPIVVDAYLAFKAWSGITVAVDAVAKFSTKVADAAAKVALTKATNAGATASTDALAAAHERAAGAAGAQALAEDALAASLKGVSASAETATVAGGVHGLGATVESVAGGSGVLAKAKGIVGDFGAAIGALGPEGLAAGAALAATGYLVHEFFVANAADAKSAAKEVENFYAALAMKTSNGNAPTTAQLQSELKASQDHLDSLKEQARQATAVLDQMQAQRENMAYPGAATDADGSAAVQADAAITKQSSAVHQLNLEVTDSAKKQAALSQALKQQADAAGADLTQIAQLEAHFGLTASAGGTLTKILSAAGVALDGNALSASAENQAAINAVNAYRLQGSAASDLAADIAKMADPLASVSDKVGALTQSFNDLSSLEGGDVVRATQNVQKSLNTLAQQLHDGKGAFDQFSDAGISSREAVDSTAQAAEAAAASIIKSGGSVSDATGEYDAWYKALVTTAEKQGVSKTALDDYLSSLGELPSQVDPDIAKLKDLAGAIDGIQDKSVTVTVNTSYVNGGAGGHRLAAGGLVAGPGSGTSDSVPIRASNGEFVVNAAATAANLPLLRAINNAPGYAAGGVIGGVAFAPGSYSTSSSSSTGSSSGSSSSKTSAQTALNKAVAADDLLEAQALAAINPTNKLALAQEAVTNATRRLNNEAKKGTTEYYQDLTKLHQAQADLTAEVQAEAKARADAQKQLASDEKSYTDLLGKESDTTAKYYADLNSLAADHAAKDQQLLAQRQTDIEGFASANQKAVTQWGSSLSFLTSNVHDQADQITKWADLLAQARAKGVSDAVISALGLDQGPQALGQLEQFSNATQDQIDALNKAVADKNAAAGQEVTTEATNNYGALGQALLAEQQSYADAVKALQTQFIADMAELAKEAQQAQTAINGDKAVMINGVYTDTSTGRAAFYGPNGEPGSATKTAYFNTKNTMPDGRTDYYHKTFDVGGLLMPGYTVAYNGTGKPEPVFTDAQLAAMGGTVELHSYLVLDGKVIDERVQKINAAKKTAILVGGTKK